MNIRRKTLIFWFLVCWLLAACAVRSPLPTVATSPPLVDVAPAPSPTPTSVFFTDVWVDNPTPSRDDQVILIGMLNRDGVFLSGIMMQATWPDPDNPRGMPNCFIQLSYARGVCIIDASKYPPGQYVPIQILFEYEGGRYTGETGFTPK